MLRLRSSVNSCTPIVPNVRSFNNGLAGFGLRARGWLDIVEPAPDAYFDLFGRRTGTVSVTVVLGRRVASRFGTN